jgi:hypothetical protein
MDNQEAIEILKSIRNSCAMGTPLRYDIRLDEALEKSIKALSNKGVQYSENVEKLKKELFKLKNELIEKFDLTEEDIEIYELCFFTPIVNGFYFKIVKIKLDENEEYKNFMDKKVFELNYPQIDFFVTDDENYNLEHSQKRITLEGEDK